MKRLGLELVAQAAVEWTGWGNTPTPSYDEARLTLRFGEVLAMELLPLLRLLQDDFYTSTAYNTVSDLEEMGAQAASEFRGRNPELPPEVADAFAWCYKHDWK